MKYTKRTAACLIAAAALMTAAYSCSSKKSSNIDTSSEPTTAQTETTAPAEEVPSDEMNITWLSYYDLNPTGNNERSAALALFEDVYGGKINYVQTTPEEKFEKLAAMIAAGEDVDMFPYESDALPNGVLKEQYEPLDPYFDTLEIDSDLWKNMNGVIEMFKYNDSHYVIPYNIEDPLLLTYSRTMMKENGLKDPYKLYLDGKWDWDTFMKMMEKFRNENNTGTSRYGICGDFCKGLIQSTGHTVINYNNGKLENNISDPEIEKAENLILTIKNKGLQNKISYWLDKTSFWFDYFPDDKSTLFYAMGDWSLGASNGANPDLDLMTVPFPKPAKADKYYIPCSYNARMLVKNSQKGKAVATYIKCERLAATEPKYLEAAKKQALVKDETATGQLRSFVTEEQYDAIQSFKDPSVITPVFDFGYGMGESMHGTGLYTYDTRGVMDNLEMALLEDNEGIDSWKALRDALSGKIDAEIEKFNKEN